MATRRPRAHARDVATMLRDVEALVLEGYGHSGVPSPLRIERVDASEPEPGHVLVVCVPTRADTTSEERTTAAQQVTADLNYHLPFTVRVTVRVVPEWTGAVARRCAHCPTKLEPDYARGICPSCLQDYADGLDDFK